MFLDRKPFLYLWRPIYRAVFTNTVWPFLARVKDLFATETLAHLTTLHSAVANIQVNQRRTEREAAAGLAQVEAHMRDLLVRIDQQRLRMDRQEEELAHLTTLHSAVADIQANQHRTERESAARLAQIEAHMRDLLVRIDQQHLRMDRQEEELAHLTTLHSAVADIQANQHRTEREGAATLAQVEAHMRDLLARIDEQRLRMDRQEDELASQWRGVESLLLCLLSSPSPCLTVDDQLLGDGARLRPEAGRADNFTG